MTIEHCKLTKLPFRFWAGSAAALPALIGTGVSMARHPQYMHNNALTGAIAHAAIGAATFAGAAGEGLLSAMFLGALGDICGRAVTAGRNTPTGAVLNRKKRGAAIGASIGMLAAIPGGMHGYHWMSEKVTVDTGHAVAQSSAPTNRQPLRVTTSSGKTVTVTPTP